MTVDDSPARRFDALARTLSVAGFDLVSSIAVDALPAPLSTDIAADAAARGLHLDRPLSVVVIGNRGGRFWSSLVRDEIRADHPVDQYSRQVTEAALPALRPARSVLVYPGDCRFSLLALGHVLGWGAPSWLGVSIHPAFGTWFAYRAVVVTDAVLPRRVLDPGEDACAACPGHDCLAACPVDAPGPPGHFALSRCIDYRLADASPCAERCLAREACPVGQGHRYPEDLVAHVYRRSLASIARWADEGRSPG